MKRSLLLLLLLILIGAAINVPIAMQFLHSRTSPRAPMIVNERDQQAASRGWPSTTPHDIPWPAPRSWSMEQAFGYQNFQVNGWEGPSSTPTDRVSMQLQRIGWPLPVLEQVQMWWPWDDPKWATKSESDPALHLVWSGVVLNPLIFGITLWLVFVLPFNVYFTIRRRLRIAKNVCIKCAYPRGTSDRCSECGHTFTPPSTETSANNS